MMIGKSKNDLFDIFFKTLTQAEQAQMKNADKAIFDFDETTNPPSIEHWAPDRYTEGDEYQDIWDQLEKEDKNSIGNLTVLNHVSNSRLGNDSPQVKFQTIKQWMKDNKVRNYGFVEQFLKTYEDDFTHWGADHIQERARNLAVEAFETVWKFNSLREITLGCSCHHQRRKPDQLPNFYEHPIRNL